MVCNFKFNKMIKKILIVLLVALVAIQFLPVDKNNAETHEVQVFEAETQPSAEVKSILTAKCYDCHSNKTAYPWYAKVAPVSLWIADHVEEGKEHLDLSNWANYKAKRKEHKLEEVYEEVEEGKMPLKSYKYLHGDLTDSERELLVNWALKAMKNY